MRNDTKYKKLQVEKIRHQKSINTQVSRVIQTCGIIMPLFKANIAKMQNTRNDSVYCQLVSIRQAHVGHGIISQFEVCDVIHLNISQASMLHKLQMQ